MNKSLKNVVKNKNEEKMQIALRKKTKNDQKIAKH